MNHIVRYEAVHVIGNPPSLGLPFRWYFSWYPSWQLSFVENTCLDRPGMSSNTNKFNASKALAFAHIYIYFFEYHCTSRCSNSHTLADRNANHGHDTLYALSEEYINQHPSISLEDMSHNSSFAVRLITKDTLLLRRHHEDIFPFHSTFCPDSSHYPLTNRTQHLRHRSEC
jgi:hypothetical protein